MKKIVTLALTLLLMLSGCGLWSGEYEPEVYAERPMVKMDGAAYISFEMPVNELPEGFVYAGALSEDEAYNTGCTGCEYYTNPNLEGEFYLYQECGTPISSDMVDTTKRQWAYCRYEVCPDP